MLRRKLPKDWVKMSICSKNSMVMNMIIPASSVKSKYFITFAMRYLFNLFNAICPEVSYFLEYCHIFFFVDPFQKRKTHSRDDDIWEKSSDDRWRMDCFSDIFCKRHKYIIEYEDQEAVEQA